MEDCLSSKENVGVRIPLGLLFSPIQLSGKINKIILPLFLVNRIQIMHFLIYLHASEL
jgi:hypothetical protein